jgi:molybdopterin-guanine dinucleotide biosynthesis protein A
VSLTAVLLTGGLSSRMGRDKATLMFEGRPLWARQLDLLRRLEPQALWISGRVTPPWTPRGTEVLLDAPPSRGPLSGIALALARMQTTHLLVLAVDLVKMTCEHLAELLHEARLGQGVVPLNQNFFEPLAAIYPKEAASFAGRALASQDLSMQTLIRRLIDHGRLSHYPLSEKQRELYLNVNRPGDRPPVREPE